MGSATLSQWVKKSLLEAGIDSQVFKMARSDFRATIPLNFERLELHNYQSNRKSNISTVLEKDESFKWSTFHQDPSYQSNEMTP